MIKINLVILTFVIIHVTLGRKVSIPYGLACGTNIYLVTGLAIMLDIIFTSLVYFLSGQALSKLKFIREIKEKVSYAQNKLGSFNLRLARFLSRLGKVGIILLTAIPLTGGINVSIPLVHSLNLSKREGLLLLNAGNFLGCLFVALGVKGILVWFSG